MGAQSSKKAEITKPPKKEKSKNKKKGAAKGEAAVTEVPAQENGVEKTDDVPKTEGEADKVDSSAPTIEVTNATPPAELKDAPVSEIKEEPASVPKEESSSTPPVQNDAKIEEKPKEEKAEVPKTEVKEESPVVKPVEPPAPTKDVTTVSVESCEPVTFDASEVKVETVPVAKVVEEIKISEIEPEPDVQESPTGNAETAPVSPDNGEATDICKELPTEEKIETVPTIEPEEEKVSPPEIVPEVESKPNEVAKVEPTEIEPEPTENAKVEPTEIETKPVEDVKESIPEVESKPVEAEIPAVHNEPPAENPPEEKVPELPAVPPPPQENGVDHEVTKVEMNGHGESEVICNGKVEDDLIEPPKIFENGITKKSVTTTFKWEHGGDNVGICGTFNEWGDPINLSKEADNLFSLTLNLSAGKYNFKYIVDGKWLTCEKQPVTSIEEHGTVNEIVVADSTD